MKDSLLPILACPRCNGNVTVHVDRRDAAEIMEGTLTCSGCALTFPIVRGVPRFAEEQTEVQERTAEAFGYEWTRYSELAARYKQQFLDWLRPVDEKFFQDKLVLEGGCGKAVKPVFDYAFSIGVLHHLPDPERGFKALVSKLKPGGAISAWVYGREGNGWIVHVVTPIREHVTSHLPHLMLDTLSGLLTVPLFAATKLLYRPTKNNVIGKALPYGPYLSYIADFPFREQRSIVFDHLVAPVAFYLTRGEFAAWFDRAHMKDVKIEHHNANSWRGFGRTSNTAAETTTG
jgi:uncharacterized protein YbaR (Trm112 family)